MPDPTWRVIAGDCRASLASLPASSVQTCVTSPPYFGLRDYGHDGQIGLEATPDEFVAALVGVFREVRRVLRDDGTVWLNLGDSYAGSWGAQSRGGPPSASSTLIGNGHVGGGPKAQSLSAVQVAAHPKGQTRTGSIPEGANYKPKDLIGIPWMVAFALRADGWYLRSDIIWSKPNPMPESVTDRPTKAHEYVFLLSKQPRYYYDADAIREDLAGELLSSGARNPRFGRAGGMLPCEARGDDTPKTAARDENGQGTMRRFSGQPEGGRNKRSVWTVATQPFPGAHFATFPPKLIEPCILAGSRAGDVVLDPFAGSGTVGVVCGWHGRDFIGLELNETYAQMARDRITAEGKPWRPRSEPPKVHADQLDILSALEPG